MIWTVRRFRLENFIFECLQAAEKIPDVFLLPQLFLIKGMQRPSIHGLYKIIWRITGPSPIFR